VLIAEDDVTLQRGLTQALADVGHQTIVAGDGILADVLLATESFDLLVLDLGLPGLDGIAVLERLRRRSQLLPVLILSARDRTEDRVKGLNCGADDYLTKPFDLSEFEARVRALLRRGQSPSVTMGRLTWLPERREAMIQDQLLELTRHETSLLESLIRVPGRIVSKEALTQLMGDGGEFAAHNLVEVYVHRMRRKLHEAQVEIRTVRGLGYRLQEMNRPVDE
jgi:DNA-binding response OmpR family regulator